MLVDFYQNFSCDSTRSANEVVQFYCNIKSTEIKKNSRHPSSNKIFYYFAPLGFDIAEYNNLPIIEKKTGGCSVPENGRKSRKMKSIVLDLSEKIKTCMDKGQNAVNHHFNSSNLVF